jgi:hypothetical protein
MFKNIVKLRGTNIYFSRETDLAQKEMEGGREGSRNGGGGGRGFQSREEEGKMVVEENRKGRTEASSPRG